LLARMFLFKGIFQIHFRGQDLTFEVWPRAKLSTSIGTGEFYYCLGNLLSYKSWELEITLEGILKPMAKDM